MKKSIKRLWCALVLFCVVETAMGILLQTTNGNGPMLFSYAAVVLACLFCICFAECSISYLFTQIALIFTLFADWFLVVRGAREQFPAMVFFSIVQLCYFARLYADDPSLKRRRVHSVVRATASVIAILLTCIVLGADADAVALVSMFYYANLLINFVFAFSMFKREYLLAIGLLLFILCDTVIGFSFLGDYLAVSQESFVYRISHLDLNLAWVFYLPSQVLLSISLLPRKLKRMKVLSNIKRA